MIYVAKCKVKRLYSIRVRSPRGCIENSKWGLAGPGSFWDNFDQNVSDWEKPLGLQALKTCLDCSKSIRKVLKYGHLIYPLINEGKQDFCWFKLKITSL